MPSQIAICARGLAAGLLLTVAAHAQTYSARDLGTLPGGATSAAFGLNNLGQVAGISTIGDANQHGFLADAALAPILPLAGDLQAQAFAVSDAGAVATVSYDYGELTPHGLLWTGGGTTPLGDIAPRGLNAAGVVVGYHCFVDATLGWVEHAAAYAGGSIADLGTLGGSCSYAADVNDAGQTVGWSFLTDDLVRRAVLWQGGVPGDLGTLGGTHSQAYAISNSGFVAGVSDTAAGEPHAFRYAVSPGGGVLARLDLGVLGGGYSYGYGVNEAGQVVGTSDGRAFVWTAGSPQDLNAALAPNNGWVLEIAWTINDRGQIAGVGQHHGQPRAFLLTPNRAGDMNCDGAVDFDDIDPFVLALSGPAAYAAVYPDCRWLNADCNGDGAVDFDDIDAFVARLGS